MLFFFSFFSCELKLLLLPELTQGQRYMRKVVDAKLPSPPTKSGVGSCDVTFQLNLAAVCFPFLI